VNDLDLTPPTEGQAAQPQAASTVSTLTDNANTAKTCSETTNHNQVFI
jgi:hypothetical protein